MVTRTGTLLVSLLVLGQAHESAEAAWDAYPSAALQAGVDDNVRLSTGNEDSAIVAFLDAGAVIRNITETSQVEGVATVRRTEFGQADIDGGTSGVAALKAIKRTERIRYGFVASYRNELLRRNGAIDLETGEPIPDSQLTIVEDPIDPDGDPDLEIGFIEEEIRKQDIRFQPSIAFRVSPRDQIQLMVNYRERMYENIPLLRLRDSHSYGGNIRYSRRLSERYTAFVGFGVDQLVPEDTLEVRRYDGRAGLLMTLSERTLLQVEAGANHARAENGTDVTAGIYRGLLQHRFVRGSLDIKAQRNNFPTAFGTVVRTDTVEGNLDYDLSERWILGLKGKFSSTESKLQSVNTADDRDYAEAETRLSYELSPAWSVGGAYRFRWVKRDQGDGSANGNAAFVFISYLPPRPL